MVRTLTTVLLLALMSHANADGQKTYNERCGACHNEPIDPKTPPLDEMRKFYQSRIHDTITTGRMSQFTQGLSEEEINGLVAFVTERVQDPEEANRLTWCENRDVGTEPLISQWGFNNRNTRNQSKSSVDSSNADTLKLKWVFDVPGSSTMRSFPAVSEDTIFLPNTTGKLYAIDRSTACVKWQFDAGSEIRTAAHLFSYEGQPMLSFGVQLNSLVVLDPTDGSVIYRGSVATFEESMITGGQVQFGSKLYVPVSAIDVALAMNPFHECCKSHGVLHAMELKDFSTTWTAHTTEDAKPTYKNSVNVQMHGPSGAPIWTTPAIDEERNQLYIGTGENTSTPATHTSDAIIAYDLDTGEEKWVFQGTKDDAFNMACGRRTGPNCPKENGPDFDFGASPILATVSTGQDLVLAGQKSGDVWALNPDSGELIWHTKLSPGSALGGVHWGMTLVNDTLVVPIADPDFVEGSNPGVFALDAKDGSIIWEHKVERPCEFSGFRSAFSFSSWPACPFHYAFSSALSSANDVAFAGALDGQVFAFDVSDGDVLWQFDTKKEFEGTNGGEAHGGAIDNPGIAIAENQVMVLSGYSMFGQMPGNALLMFEVETSD